MTEASRAPLVLNVNDTPGARYMVTLMLQKAGFRVLEAATGAEALAVTAAQSPEVVVLDLRLPDLSGFEVCRRIRALPPAQPIKILHTSATFVTTEHKVKSLDEGADGYLMQPFEPEELIATVRSLLRLNDAERELRERAEQLREADRRKDEFLAMLGHELRNPMAAIGSSLPLLDRNKPQDEVERRAREVLRRQTAHLGRLVDDLLDVARVTQGKIVLQKELFDLRALVTRVADSVERTRVRPRRQTLRVSLPDAPLMVRGDITRLEQVVVNLLDNACKYTDEGGELELVLDRRLRDERHVARVLVRDNGMGISSTTLPTIFGLFAQASRELDRARGGLGIGLTLARSLVALHGGTITAHSDGPGRGSEFKFEIPAEAPLPATEQPPIAPASPAPHPERACRVLIVEDSVDVQEMLSQLVTMWGHEVVCASDGLAGVARALELRPDGALVDIGLPGIDGYEVAQRIRSDPRGEDLFLVALTGYGSNDQRARALQSGFDLHLVKPVNVDRLAMLIEEIAARGHRRDARRARPSA